VVRGRLIAILAVLCTAVVVVPASADARAFGSRTLKRGSVGTDVKTLQRYLTKVGYRTSADGVFGRGTQRVVRAWEAGSQLVVNGRVSRPDAKVLKAAVATLKPPATMPPPTTDVAPARPEDEVDGAGGANFVQVEAATLNPDGTATAPASAPEAVKQIILHGNEIAFKPYVYGGGHGEWFDRGYDCSGSVSYALHFAGLLKTSLDSTGFESYGSAGRGTWVTVYANAGHAYMEVAGLRFDTSAAKGGGSRWTDEPRSSSGYVIRHPQGL
jgi:peptidoglycan hydrolase-like protein with peptidoglycan-binding domain